MGASYAKSTSTGPHYFTSAGWNVIDLNISKKESGYATNEFVVNQVGVRTSYKIYVRIEDVNNAVRANPNNPDPSTVFEIHRETPGYVLPVTFPLVFGGDDPYYFTVGPVPANLVLPSSGAVGGGKYGGTTESARASTNKSVDTADFSTILNSNVRGYGNQFMGNTNIQTVGFFENSPLIVSYGAFQDCTNLKIIRFEGTSSVVVRSRAFKGCTSLTEIQFPNDTTIWPESFIGSSIEKVVFNGSKTVLQLRPDPVPPYYNSWVSLIGLAIFEGCLALKRVVFNNTTTSLEAPRNVPFPRGDTVYYEGGMFGRENNVQEVTFNGGNVTLTTRAFNVCKKLETVHFNSCTNLYVGSYLITGCTSLKAIFLTAPRTATVNIDPNAFVGVPNVTLIVSYEWSNYSSLGGIPTNLMISGQFFNTAYNGTYLYAKPGVQYTGDIVIPEGVERIDPNLFAGSNIKSITLPKSLLSILESSFANCRYLETVIFAGPRGDSNFSILSNAFENCVNLTSINIPDQVFRIDHFAFSGCVSLKSITLPARLSGLNCLFKGCINLETITFSSLTNMENGFRADEDLGVFEGLQSLKTITLPSTIRSLEPNAFKMCVSLTNVILPPSLIIIDKFAFYGCYALTSLTIPSGVTMIDEYGFGSCINLTSISIPSTVTAILGGAFFSCFKLESLTLPSNLIYIGSRYELRDVKGTFENCTGLTSIVFPASVLYIGDFSFFNCTKLTSLTIPSTVQYLGTGAFASCTGITSPTILANITTVPDYVFNGCSGLTSITLTPLVTSIGNYAFYGCTRLANINLTGILTIGNSAFKDCSNLTSLTLPSTLTTIGDSAFSGCYRITSTIDIPIGVSNISSFAFFGCTGITTVGLNIVNTIGDSAFAGSGLQSVNFPATLTSIGSSAYANCLNLGYVSFRGNQPAAANGCFDGINTDRAQVFGGTWVYSVPIPFRIGGKLAIVPFGDNVTILLVENGIVTNMGSDGTPTNDPVVPENAGITGISSTAFQNKTSLRTISLPSGVASIPDSAFAGCSDLRSITSSSPTITIGNLSFSGCVQLSRVSFQNIQSIGNNGFDGCTLLTEIEYYTSIVSIGDSAFFGCVRLSNVTSLPNVVNLGNSAFAGSGITSMTLPPNTTTIGDSVFSNCIDLQTITCSSPLITIGKQSFSGCTQLTNVSFQMILGIGESAFNGCSNLETITSLTDTLDIGASAFYNCGNFNVDVRFNALKSLGDAAFMLCGIPSVIFSTPKLKTIGNNVFQAAYLLSAVLPPNLESIGTNAFTQCGLTSIDIPLSVKTIGYCAFRRCASLKYVFIHAVSRANIDIDRLAFYETTGVIAYVSGVWTDAPIGGDITIIVPPNGSTTECVLNLNQDTNVIVRITGNVPAVLVLPDEVTGVETNAFSGKTTLTSITFPVGLTYIGPNAFSGCRSIRTIRFIGLRPAGNGTNGAGIDGTVFTSVPVVATTVNIYGLWTDELVGGLPVFPATFPGTSTLAGCVLVLSGTVITRTIGVIPDGYSVRIPDGITEIGPDVLSGTQMRSLTLPASLVKIGANAFSLSKPLEYITFLGSRPPSIDPAAFSITPNLLVVYVTGVWTTLYIGGITKIPVPIDANSCVFYVDQVSKNLYDYIGTLPARLTIPEGVTSIANNVFLPTSGRTMSLNLQSVTFPSTLVSIGTFAFGSCVNIRDLIFTSNFTPNVKLTIQSSAFNGCTALSALRFPFHLSTIGGLAFTGTAFTNVTFPPNVQTLSSQAFYNCLSLSSLTFQGLKPKTIANNCFENDPITSISVPPGWPATDTLKVGRSLTPVGVTVSGTPPQFTVQTASGSSVSATVASMTSLEAINAIPDNTTALIAGGGSIHPGTLAQYSTDNATSIATAVTSAASTGVTALLTAAILPDVNGKYIGAPTPVVATICTAAKASTAVIPDSGGSASYIVVDLANSTDGIGGNVSSVILGPSFSGSTATCYFRVIASNGTVVTTGFSVPVTFVVAHPAGNAPKKSITIKHYDDFGGSYLLGSPALSRSDLTGTTNWYGFYTLNLTQNSAIQGVGDTYDNSGTFAAFRPRTSSELLSLRKTQIQQSLNTVPTIAQQDSSEQTARVRKYSSVMPSMPLHGNSATLVKFKASSVVQSMVAGQAYRSSASQYQPRVNYISPGCSNILGNILRTDLGAPSTPKVIPCTSVISNAKPQVVPFNPIVELPLRTNDNKAVLQTVKANTAGCGANQ
jgi:hypothetical protein